MKEKYNRPVVQSVIKLVLTDHVTGKQSVTYLSAREAQEMMFDLRRTLGKLFSA